MSFNFAIPSSSNGGYQAGFKSLSGPIGGYDRGQGTFALNATGGSNDYVSKPSEADYRNEYTLIPFMSSDNSVFALQKQPFWTFSDEHEQFINEIMGKVDGRFKRRKTSSTWGSEETVASRRGMPHQYIYQGMQQHGQAVVGGPPPFMNWIAAILSRDNYNETMLENMEEENEETIKMIKQYTIPSTKFMADRFRYHGCCITQTATANLYYGKNKKGPQVVVVMNTGNTDMHNIWGTHDKYLNYEKTELIPENMARAVPQNDKCYFVLKPVKMKHVFTEHPPGALDLTDPDKISFQLDSSSNQEHVAYSKPYIWQFVPMHKPKGELIDRRLEEIDVNDYITYRKQGGGEIEVPFFVSGHIWCMGQVVSIPAQSRQYQMLLDKDPMVSVPATQRLPVVAFFFDFLSPQSLITA